MRTAPSQGKSGQPCRLIGKGIVMCGKIGDGFILELVDAITAKAPSERKALLIFMRGAMVL